MPKTADDDFVVSPDVVGAAKVRTSVFGVRGEWSAADKRGVVLGDPVACEVGEGGGQRGRCRFRFRCICICVCGGDGGQGIGDAKEERGEEFVT